YHIHGACQRIAELYPLTPNPYGRAAFLAARPLAAHYERMSRAFVNEDAGGPERRYNLPKRDDPGYDAAAAWALLEGANAGDSYGAELATGYRWGDAWATAPRRADPGGRARRGKRAATAAGGALP